MTKENILTFLFGIAIGLVLGLFINAFYTVERSYMESTAIKNGCGEYNSTTAEFHWINKKGL